NCGSYKPCFGGSWLLLIGMLKKGKGEDVSSTSWQEIALTTKTDLLTRLFLCSCKRSILANLNSLAKMA
ncbi:MAG TPA: hypothetical protein VIQ31_35180, partial [Phormidium sp.]